MEALRARTPATELLVRLRIDLDDRVHEAVTLASAARTRGQGCPSVIDRRAGDVVHQMLLIAEPFRYTELDSLLDTPIRCGWFSTRSPTPKPRNHRPVGRSVRRDCAARPRASLGPCD